MEAGTHHRPRHATIEVSVAALATASLLMFSPNAVGEPDDPASSAAADDLNGPIVVRRYGRQTHNGYVFPLRVAISRSNQVRYVARDSIKPKCPLGRQRGADYLKTCVDG